MSVMVERGNQVQEIKEAVNIVDLVSQYTTLTPAGKRMKGLSPFTNEKTPSFFVDPDDGVYYCFSSQKGGDIFTFVQETEGVDFKEALKILAERAGIELSSGQSEVVKQDNKRLHHLLEVAADTYKRNCTGEIIKYLHARGITDESIRAWGIGYAPNAWNTLCTKKISGIDEHVTAGLCVQKEKSVYDRFRNRIQFPFHDSQGRVIGFSGRIYGDGEGAKYINSPESPIFHKSTFLYGLHKAKPHIRKHNVAILTEGPIDAIMVHQAGYPMTVATSGTAVTEEHLKTLQRISNRLLIILDGDAAGKRAALRVIEMTFILGIDSKIVVLPEGKDPADIVQEDVSQFKEAVRAALSAAKFLVRYVGDVYGDESGDRLRGVREVALPIIAASKDLLVREHAIQEIASFCNIDVDKIKEHLEQTQSGTVQEDTILLKRVKEIPNKEKKLHPYKNPKKSLITALQAINYLRKHKITCDEGGSILSEAKEVFGNPSENEVNYEVAKLYFEGQGQDSNEKDRKECLGRAQTVWKDSLKELESGLKRYRSSQDLKEADFEKSRKKGFL